MIALKQILVATDFSETAASALRYGCALAEAFKAELHVLHVINEPSEPTWAAYGYLPEITAFRKALKEGALANLNQVLSHDDVERFHPRLVLKWGPPFLEIVRYAREQNIDLIVIGTHGRGPIAHMLMGSVAEKVVRKAPCPVLTVRPGEHEFVLP